MVGPCFSALPELLSRSQYKNPDNPTASAFQLGHNTNEHLFDWLSQRPERLSEYQNHMAGYRTGRPSWMNADFYPVEENLVEGAKNGSDAVFMVDVGGGKGRDIQEMNRKHPNLPGKLVLQDLKGVIQEAQESGLDKNVEPMEHDFFTKQPIYGTCAPRSSLSHPLTRNQVPELTTCIPVCMTGPRSRPKRSSKASDRAWRKATASS